MIVQNVNAVIAAFRATMARHAKGCERGLKRAGLMLQRASQKLVPIDTGNLRASAFTRAEGSGFETVVTVGYTASYALFVHEDLPAKYSPHKYKRGRQSKFLEQPARELGPQLAAIVKEEMAK